MGSLHLPVEFMLSANALGQLPPDTGAEVAFAGRSNAGKSRAINAITRANIARTSKTPGRTQHINLFRVDDERRLVDLPGYGYAKVPEAIKRHWQGLIDRYVVTRQCLRGIVLVMDIRHPLKPFDVHMLEWCAERRMPAHVLLTKADKLKRGPAMASLHSVQQAMKQQGLDATVQLFSALAGTGVEEARQHIGAWLGLAQTNDRGRE